MNINKDNYEEYFLLFADNELTDQEKNMVEDFVDQHPDLEEEFLGFKQSVLTPENDLKLEDKTSLFRHTKKIINHTNYPEVFVLYIDDELTSQERIETEAFLSETPSLKNEFDIFQKIKLQPDKTIVFPNKKLLLKREDYGKVVPFKWWKAIAAAILLGTGLWIGLLFKNNDKIEAPVVIKTNSPKLVIPVLTDTANSKQLNVVAENNSATPGIKQKKFLQNNSGKSILNVRNTKQPEVVKTRQQKNHLPGISNIIKKEEKELANIIVREVQKNNNETMIEKDNDSNNDDISQKESDDMVTSDLDVVPGVTAAAYAMDESENNNNYAFYNITEEKFNKSKIGGFLRKVKRTIERKISPFNNTKNQREMAVNGYSN